MVARLVSNLDGQVLGTYRDGRWHGLSDRVRPAVRVVDGDELMSERDPRYLERLGLYCSRSTSLRLEVEQTAENG